jgi:hypothetical protein
VPDEDEEPPTQPRPARIEVEARAVLASMSADAATLDEMFATFRS